MEKEKFTIDNAFLMYNIDGVQEKECEGYNLDNVLIIHFDYYNDSWLFNLAYKFIKRYIVKNFIPDETQDNWEEIEEI